MLYRSAPAARHGAAPATIISGANPLSPGHVAGLAGLIKGSNGGFVELGAACVLIGTHVTASRLHWPPLPGSILNWFVQLGSCVWMEVDGRV